MDDLYTRSRIKPELGLPWSETLQLEFLPSSTIQSHVAGAMMTITEGANFGHHVDEVLSK